MSPGRPNKPTRAEPITVVVTVRRIVDPAAHRLQLDALDRLLSARSAPEDKVP
jgi:hypothetical protein